MSLHLRSVHSPHVQGICGGYAARLTDDPLDPGMNCRECVEVIAFIRAAVPEPKRETHPATMIGRGNA